MKILKSYSSEGKFVNMKDNYQTEAECEAVRFVSCIGTICPLPKTKMISQTEAGGGECEASRRKTRRPKSWLAGQPRWIHAPVHQVGHDDQDG